jgi:rubrerythrin
MPVKNEKVFCINHPDESMVQSEDEIMLYYTEQREDKKYYHTKSAFIGDLYMCPICGYVELYNIRE